MNLDKQALKWGLGSVGGHHNTVGKLFPAVYNTMVKKVGISNINRQTANFLPLPLV